ncbi:MAG: DUF3347 domain-containing protein [Verrucomicrobiota bacterium]|nr:DUF3347 domain-containing protein [Verrucomicrobiota bacterium]
MKMINPFIGFMLVGVLFASATAQSSFASAPQEVLSHYLRVQETLAQDSMQNVSAQAQTLAEAARGNESQTLPLAIAQQADVLAKAKTLDQARQAFEPLSGSLIAYFKTNRVPPGTYYEVYCPIVKASWLQTSGTIKNPYLGPRSATPTWGWSCAGVVKTIFESPSAAIEPRGANIPHERMNTYDAPFVEQTGIPVGKTNSAGGRMSTAPGNAALFSGSKEAGFTYAFSRSVRGKLTVSSNGGKNDEWRNRQPGDYAQFPEGRIWGGDDANRKPDGLRLISWSW